MWFVCLFFSSLFSGLYAASTMDLEEGGPTGSAVASSHATVPIITKGMKDLSLVAPWHLQSLLTPGISDREEGSTHGLKCIRTLGDVKGIYYLTLFNNSDTPCLFSVVSSDPEETFFTLISDYIDGDVVIVRNYEGSCATLSASNTNAVTAILSVLRRNNIITFSIYQRFLDKLREISG